MPEITAELLALSANIKPGDRVLIGLSSTAITEQQAHQLYHRLESWFPGVHFNVIAGVSCMAVQRREDVPDAD